MSSSKLVIVEPYSLRNRLRKLGPGHFQVVQINNRVNRPVAEEDQDPSKTYCPFCDRKLNTNNSSGICSVCIRAKRSLAL